MVRVEKRFEEALDRANNEIKPSLSILRGNDQDNPNQDNIYREIRERDFFFDLMNSYADNRAIFEGPEFQQLKDLIDLLNNAREQRVSLYESYILVNRELRAINEAKLKYNNMNSFEKVRKHGLELHDIIANEPEVRERLYTISKNNILVDGYIDDYIQQIETILEDFKKVYLEAFNGRRDDVVRLIEPVTFKSLFASQEEKINRYTNLVNEILTTYNSEAQIISNKYANTLEAINALLRSGKILRGSKHLTAEKINPDSLEFYDQLNKHNIVLLNSVSTHYDLES